MRFSWLVQMSYSLFFFFFCSSPSVSFFFFFNDTATTEIYTLSLHDALPIYHADPAPHLDLGDAVAVEIDAVVEDRKSTRLNSSHVRISYAVFCLKKKKKNRSISSHRS